jgi:hypothetical protein
MRLRQLLLKISKINVGSTSTVFKQALTLIKYGTVNLAYTFRQEYHSFVSPLSVSMMDKVDKDSTIDDEYQKVIKLIILINIDFIRRVLK